MNAPGPNAYLKTRVMTASPEELRLMLYDGAIKFCSHAIPALEQRNYEESYEQISRAQRVVLELSSSLDPSIAPEICDKLAGLYTYIYRLLITANTEHRLDPLREAVQLLEYERSTWVMLMDKLKAEGNPRPNGYGSRAAEADPAAPKPGAAAPSPITRVYGGGSSPAPRALPDQTGLGGRFSQSA